jgi:ATP-dependent DNA helicase RecQ
LAGREDVDIQDWFIRTAFPPRAQAERVVALLEEAALPMSLAAIEAEVNVRQTRLEAMLKILEVEGAVERADGRWLRTLRPWAYDEGRVERVTAARRAEQAAMHNYAETMSCRMEFLREQLDDDEAAPCGYCDRCRSWSLDVPLSAGLIAEAARFLRQRPIELGPRKRWPGAGPIRGSIPEAIRNRTGRALSCYNDGGWGTVVKDCKYGGAALPDELVEAAAEVVLGWQPDPPPLWLTHVPSSQHPGLVADFARRLGVRLGLPVHDVVRRVRRGRPQKDMENSPQQLQNVYGAFMVVAPVPEFPVLLVDDIVDSGWTLTVVGTALREAGAGPVHPLVLAQAVSS